jgi:hypothetical protein
MESFELVFSPGDLLLKETKSLLTTNTKGMVRKHKNVIAALTIVGVGLGATLRKMAGFWKSWRMKKRLRKKQPQPQRNPQKMRKKFQKKLPPGLSLWAQGLRPLVLKPKNPLWRSRMPNMCLLSLVLTPPTSSFLISLIQVNTFRKFISKLPNNKTIRS